MRKTRRAFLTAGAAGLGLAAQAPAGTAIVVDPAPRFEFSRRFYMQFMEPLGVTDSSVEASWDHERDDWRKDLVETTRDLAPDVLRWGGIYCRYYRWREGVGEPKKRPPMYNYAWGGWETQRVGTHEFVDFCRRVGAEPLYCVNFAGDGVERYRQDGRWGDAREAADWVSYANDAEHAERKKNGAAAPLGIKLWQLGNETSYGAQAMRREDCIRQTIGFSRAMRARDKSIELIGWGDYGRGTGARELWAHELLKQAGEHIDAVAFHMMGMSPRRKETLLRGNRYQKDPAGAWEELLELAEVAEQRVSEMEQALAAQRARHWIAITEGHLSLVPHNANPILLEWLSAAYHARTMITYHRHGAKVRMATGADFAGNRWTVNAVMMQTPRGVSFLTPAGSVMRLFKRHNGQQGVGVKSAPADLDVTASRTGNRVFLHVLNKNFRRAAEVAFAVQGRAITGGRVIAIAPEDARTAVGLDQPSVFAPQESALGADGRWRFPAASVSAVELELA
jgi:alpha-L-arabinofuranosidase